MADKTDGSVTANNNDYESTPEDKKRARILGIVYVILAIFLAWMLFKIWPPTPWPNTKDLIENPQLAKDLREAECPTPSPSPNASPKPSTETSATNSETNVQGLSSSPTVKPSPTQSVSPGSSPKAASSPTGGKGTQVGAATPSPSPSPSPSATPTPPDTLVNVPINFFWGYWCYRTSFDERLILLVIVAGMLGSFVHGATSLADFIGNNKFNKNWTWFYLLRPAIGMSLALVFYFVIRGGFLTTSGGAKDINPYGIAALAGMVGMFSKQATDKLSEVFGALFRAKPGEGDDKRSGSLNPQVKSPTVASIKPPTAAAGTNSQAITVTGTNFVDGCKVFLDDKAQPTKFVSTTQVDATLGPAPPDQSFAANKKFKLKVVNPDGSSSAAVDFTVT